VKREAELNEVLKQEDARRATATKNMQRLHALRIERNAKTQTAEKVKNALDPQRVAASL
jgi:hypothetical protein